MGTPAICKPARDPLYPQVAPARDSLYLQIGVSENDAEEQGLSQLDTELTITDTGRQDGRYNNSNGVQQSGGV
eukprot:scaffold10524_cov17-Tisochrysis_lutea.AAC.6